MPTSITLNANDPVYAQREINKAIWNQFSQESILLSCLFGGTASMKTGDSAFKVEMVKIGKAREAIQENIQISPTVTHGNIALTATHTTAIDTTRRTPAQAIYGDWTLYYGTAPYALYDEVHGGDGANISYEDTMIATIANDLTTQIVDAVLGDGATTTLDGYQKWTSKTDTKWGINTTNAANFYYRGQSETVASASFDEAKVRDWIRLCRTGDQINAGGTVHEYSNGRPCLGLVDYTTYDKMIAWVSARQNIPMTSMQTEITKLGASAQAGVVIDGVTFFPDLGIERLRQTKAVVGLMIILNPEDFKFYIHPKFNFRFLNNPNKDLTKDEIGTIKRQFANVVWGEYSIAMILCNMFCKKPRNQLYATIT